LKPQNSLDSGGFPDIVESMRNLSPGHQLRCLSCGEQSAHELGGKARLRSRSGRFAFAPCERCRCVRMMAVETAASARATLAAAAR